MSSRPGSAPAGGRGQAKHSTMVARPQSATQGRSKLEPVLYYDKNAPQRKHGIFAPYDLPSEATENAGWDLKSYRLDSWMGYFRERSKLWHIELHAGNTPEEIAQLRVLHGADAQAKTRKKMMELNRRRPQSAPQSMKTRNFLAAKKEKELQVQQMKLNDRPKSATNHSSNKKVEEHFTPK